MFSPRDFLDLGERATIDSALHRLAAKGQVRRVIRGLYDYPRFSELLKQQLSPEIDQVARALARKFRWRIQPSGATALNLLGLSTQVPSRAVYLSDGPDRNYKIGSTSLVFEHTALKEAGFNLRESGLIVQALKSLGQERMRRSHFKDQSVAAGLSAFENLAGYQNRHGMGIRRDSASRTEEQHG